MKMPYLYERQMQLYSLLSSINMNVINYKVGFRPTFSALGRASKLSLLSLTENVLFSILFVLSLASCSNEQILDRLEYIKGIGDSDPTKALAMLDSINIEAVTSDRYTQAKYDLLRIRLSDKSEIMPVSDISIRNLVQFFESKGSDLERMEVLYYAGSVYRDLDDTPRSLEYFLKVLDLADECDIYDSVMIRNTYSNLQYLYYGVQDYANAAVMAKKELLLCKLLKEDLVLPYMHVGASYVGTDSIPLAMEAFDFALKQIKSAVHREAYQDALVLLINDYSQLGETEKARECRQMIQNVPVADCGAFACIAFAQYYYAIGLRDSAEVYCRHVLEENSDISNMYNAAKLMFKLCREYNDVNDAVRYADLYLSLSDSLDFGKRQELAATINNEYKYHLDQKKERLLIDENNRYKNMLICVFSVAAIIICLMYILHIQRRNKHLLKYLHLTQQFQQLTDGEMQLRDDIVRKEEELSSAKSALMQKSSELDDVKTEVEHLKLEISKSEKALKDKERQLSDRIEQNKIFMNLLHKAEFEGRAEDIILAVRQSSNGMKKLKTNEWKQLYQAVDSLYPLFKDRLLSESDTYTEKQMQICYLMRIGLSKQQMQNMTDLSRVTIWRWTKKFNWVLSAKDDNSVV